MRVLPISCLSDNYSYLVLDRSGAYAAVVDPPEAEPIAEALEQLGADLTQIWVTHHHWDHVGGIEELIAKQPALTTIGSAYDLERGRIPNQKVGLSDGESFDFHGHRVEIRAVPGHTLGAIAFLVEGHLFSGDTLFLGGCGRVFEGTMEMMSQSLASLRSLPAETQIWCGHEYTASNLRFAATVDPENEAIRRAQEDVAERRRRLEPTVPGRLADELQTNPFLRFDRPELAKGRAPVESFRALREAKDRF